MKVENNDFNLILEEINIFNEYLCEDDIIFNLNKIVDIVNDMK